MKKVLYLAGWLFLSFGAKAAMEDYLPFAPTAPPPMFNLVPWTGLPHGPQHYEFVDPAPPAYHLIVDSDVKTGVATIEFRQHDGKLILSTRLDYTLHGAEVYSTDLNGDKTPDFIINTGTAANGLGPNRCIVFLLSTPKGYVAQSVVGNDIDPTRDFFDLQKDGHPVMLLMRLIEGEKGKDGKTHNYWVSNLLGFQGGKIISANARDARFPCWVLYTFKPNHAPEDQLTPGQRVKLWQVQMANEPDAEASFVDLGILANEQAGPISRSGALY